MPWGLRHLLGSWRHRNQSHYETIQEENQSLIASPYALKALVNRCHNTLDYLCNMTEGAALHSAYRRNFIIVKIQLLFVQIETIHTGTSPPCISDYYSLPVYREEDSIQRTENECISNMAQEDYLNWIASSVKYISDFCFLVY
jgi:hypothetical protein